MSEEEKKPIKEDEWQLSHEKKIRPFEWADKHRPKWHKKVYGCGR
jgi:hypothetical protein